MFLDPAHKCKLHPKAGLYLKDCGTFASRKGTVIHKVVVKCAEPGCGRRVGKPIMHRHKVADTPPALLPKSIKPMTDGELFGWLLLFVVGALFVAWMICECPIGWWGVLDR
jgi:hypothetical protein